MIINTTHKFIFLKTKKTASTTLEEYFFNYNTDEDNNISFNLLENLGPLSKFNRLVEIDNRVHASASEIFAVMGDSWNDYFKITSIRNPFEKAISSYFFLGEMFGANYNLDTIKQDFQKWLEESSEYIQTTLCDSYIYKLNNDVCVDFFIRVEQLEEDLEKCCQKLGIKFMPEKLEKLNATSRPKWATAELMYTTRSKEIVHDICEFEINYFNYSFPK